MGLGDGIGTSGLFSTRLLDFNWTELYTPFDNVRTQINGLAFPVVAKNRSDRYMFSGSNQSMLPLRNCFYFCSIIAFCSEATELRYKFLFLALTLVSFFSELMELRCKLHPPFFFRIVRWPSQGLDQAVILSNAFSWSILFNNKKNYIYWFY